MARDVAVSHVVHRGSVVLDIHPTSPSLNLSNELAASSSMSLPWFFEEKDLSPSSVVNALSSLLCIGNQSTLLAHNLGLDLCGGVPYELPREVLCDAVAMSVSFHKMLLFPSCEAPLKSLLCTSGCWYQWVFSEGLMIW